jgi:hypothetical protein
MTRTSARMAVALAALALSAGATGINCSKGSSNDDNGRLKIALTLPSGEAVNTVAYEVRASGGAVVRSGNVNTSDANATASVDTSVPAGMGYTVVMSATTGAGSSCSGTSMPFNVTAGGTTMVGVGITCGTPQGNGSVIVNGTFNVCPVLTSWMASPLQTSANGGRIDVSATATDADPADVLTFAWTAPSGSFVAASAATTQFVCGPAGSLTLLLTVSDGHSPNPCSATMTFPVTCVGGGGGTGGAGTGGAGTGGAGTGGAGTGGAGTGGAGTGGAGMGCTDRSGAACQMCVDGSSAASCASFNVAPQPSTQIPTVTGQKGCCGFPEPQRTNCMNLLTCIRTQNCVVDGDTTPCLCGELDPVTCLTGGSTPGVCAPQYTAALAGGPTGSVFTLFVDPRSPVGVANNMYSCGADTPCTTCTQ